MDPPSMCRLDTTRSIAHSTPNGNERTGTQRSTRVFSRLENRDSASVEAASRYTEIPREERRQTCLRRGCLRGLQYNEQLPLLLRVPLIRANVTGAAPKEVAEAPS